MQPGDLVSLLIGPRDGNHSCDLTDLELTLTNAADGRVVEPDRRRVARRPGRQSRTPTGSATRTSGISTPKRSKPATRIRRFPPVRCWPAGRRRTAPRRSKSWPPTCKQLLTGPRPADAKHPDAVLYRQLASLGGPLFAGARTTERTPASRPAPADRQRRLGPRPGTVRPASRAASARSTRRACACRRRASSKSACRPSWSPAASWSRPPCSIRKPAPREACRRVCRTIRPESLTALAGRSAGVDRRGQRRAKAVRAGFRRLPPLVSRRAVLHADRAGRRSRDADAVSSRGRAAVPADARRARERPSSTGCGTSCTSSATTR